METFAEIVRSRADDDKVGLWFEGREWTWREIIREAAARASLLNELPIASGKTQRHVGILMQNIPDFFFWVLAASITGDAIAGINPTRRGDELAQDIRHVDCDLLVKEPFYDELLSDVTLNLPPGRIIDVEAPEYLTEVRSRLAAHLPETIPSASAISLLLFSSGSTGAPKAVIFSQGRLRQLTAALAERISIHRDSVAYMCLPLFHGHALLMNLATSAAFGAKVVMVRRFSASRFADDILRHNITYFNYVGRVLNYVLAQPEREQDLHNSLEVAFGSEAPHSEATEFARRFNCEVREGYGASEGGVRIVPVPGAPTNSLGLPAGGINVEIRDPETNIECPRAVFDEHGRLLNAEAATGEIVAVGQGHRFEGYYNNPNAQAERLRFDGTDFWMGDLGFRDEEGYFYFAGRPSDWLRVDGENFGVSPVEHILARFPAFAGVHCFGVPDPVTGDRLMCAFTLNDGHTFDPDAFSTFLDEQQDLGTKWRPTFMRFIAEVPLTASGKINKTPLRAVGWEGADVWFSSRHGGPYEPLTDGRRGALRTSFREHGRANFLPEQVEETVSA